MKKSELKEGKIYWIEYTSKDKINEYIGCGKLISKSAIDNDYRLDIGFFYYPSFAKRFIKRLATAKEIKQWSESLLIKSKKRIELLCKND